MVKIKEKIKTICMTGLFALGLLLVGAFGIHGHSVIASAESYPTTSSSKCSVCHSSGTGLSNSTSQCSSCGAVGTTSLMRCNYCASSGTSRYWYYKTTGTASRVPSSCTTSSSLPTCTASGWVKYTCKSCSAVYSMTLQATGHSYTKVATVPATCTSGGYTNYRCTKCDYSYNGDEKGPLGHSFSAWTTTKEATCTSSGTKVRKCGRCSTSESDTIAALGHNSVSYSNVVATCMGNGYSGGTYCSRCNTTLTSRTTTSALGHSYGSWSTTKSATCTADGSKKRTCSRCSNVEYGTITKLGHAYSNHVVNPTCTAGGYTSHTCSRCSSSYTDNATAALGHNYGTWQTTKDATCTADGSKKRTCTACSNVENATISKLGHAYSNNTVNSTCTAGGYTSHTCSRCGTSYTDGATNALGHSYGDWTTEKASTCTTDGSLKRSCTRCSNAETKTVAKLGHNYKSTTTETSCTVDGKTVYICNRCNDSYTVAGTPAFGHDYKNTIINATCTSGGSTIHTCNRCGNSYTDGLTSALGHNFSSWSTSKEATCVADGLSVRGCSRCNLTESKAIAKLGHDYKETVTPAACVNGGVSSFVCSRCNDSYEGNYKPALGHDYKVEVVAATCLEDGYTKHTCSRCNDSYNDSIISANGHNFTTVKVDATCETNGFDGEKCENCGMEIQNNIVPAFGHSYASAVISSADCTHDGLRRFICDRCGESYDKIIRASGHTYEIINESHSGGNVIRRYSCLTCADTYEQVLEEQYDMVSNYMITIFDEYSPYMVWVFLATSAIWSVAMGVSIIIAHKNEDKVKAKKMLINYGIGMVAIFVILIAAPLLIYGIASIVG